MNKIIHNSDIKLVYYKGYARTENFFGNDRLTKIIELAREKSLSSYSRLLDIGCGDGKFTAIIGGEIKVKNLYGIDISPKAVEKAKKNNINAFTLDIDKQNLNFHKNFFDLVICGNLLELVLDPDHLLLEIKRVLKKDGRAIISFPSISCWASRLSLLFGYLPFYYRISRHYDLGKPFLGIKKGESTGFIRLYNPNTFTKLAQIYGLSAIKTIGAEENFFPKPFKLVDKFFSRFPNFACQVICLCEKKSNEKT